MALAILNNEELPQHHTRFSYLKKLPLYDVEKPYYCSIDLRPEEQNLRTNLDYEWKPAVVRDIRGWEHKLDLDRNGLQYIKHATPFAPRVEGEGQLSIDDYMKEHIQLIQEKLRAEKCIAYSWRHRHAGPKAIDTNFLVEKDSEPSETPHIDHTTEGGFRRVRAHLMKEEQDLYMNEDWRLRIINIWRPLFNPVYNDALAFCDPSSFDPSKDITDCDRVTADYVGEIYYLHYSPNQIWYSLSYQTPDEALCFTSFDSEKCFQNAFFPHTSFKIDGVEGLPERHSLELRIITITRKTV